MAQQETIVKSRNLIEKYLEVMGATNLYTVQGSILTPVKPEEKKPTEEDILATRPRKKYVYNFGKKDFDVYTIKVEKRQGEYVPINPTKEKKERVSKGVKLATKVPISSAKTVEKHYSPKRTSPVHQPKSQH